MQTQETTGASGLILYSLKLIEEVVLSKGRIENSPNFASSKPRGAIAKNYGPRPAVDVQLSTEYSRRIDELDSAGLAAGEALL